MERKRPTCEPYGDEVSSDDCEGVRLAERAKKTLDPLSIPFDRLAEDPFLGEETVSDYLHRQKSGQSS